MRTPMYFAAFFAVLLGCSADKVTNLDNTVTPHSGFFVSVDGSQTGDGSSTNPWTLATALAQPGIVKPGDTIWIHGGTYKGDVISTLTGTAGAPIVLRQFPGERATIDGRLDIKGRYAYYWGFEVIYSDPQRVTTLSGSRPADLPRNLVTVFVSGPFNKLINLVIHDLGDGLFSGIDAEGLEIYGTLVYNNGWIGPDRGHGHGLYLQNQLTTKRVIDNIIFNNFSSGLKTGGSAIAYMINFEITGNSVFASGAPALLTYPWQVNVEAQGGGGNIGNITYSGNSIYHIDPNNTSLTLGDVGLDSVSLYPLTFTKNIVQGMSDFCFWAAGSSIRGNKFTSGPAALTRGGMRLLVARLKPGQVRSGWDWDNNSYAYVPSTIDPFYKTEAGLVTVYNNLAAWQGGTGWDGTGSFITGTFPGMDIIVRPNLYEPGRASVTIWNWTGASTANVDLSGVLKVGDKYTVHHVYDFYGPAVDSSTYSGAPVSIPLRAYTPPTPIGMSSAPLSAGSEFNVFIVKKS